MLSNLASANGAAAALPTNGSMAKEQELSDTRAAFLLEASAMLASTLEYEETLSKVARLAVPQMADWCIVELAGTNGTTTAVEIAHVDPAKRELAIQLRQKYPADPKAKSGVPNVLRTGVSELYEEITLEMMALGARDSEHLKLLTALQLRSAMTVPMMARGRTLGAISLIVSESDRRYGRKDLLLAEDLAQRVAVAVDNARLFLEAREAVRTRDDLLGIVSHDLRNPLAVVRMQCAEVLEGLPDNELGNRLKGDLAVIDRSAARMERMIHDLLDFASIDAGRLSVEPQAQDAIGLVQEVAESLKPVLGKRTIAVDTDGMPPDAKVKCDRGRVLQVFGNLLGNALKFTPEGGKICIGARLVDAEIQFAVKDTGCGIPESALPNIFEKYWQEQHKRRTGVGLGLFIARRLVEAHGGNIWVESKVGKDSGTTFFFTLPLVGATQSRRILIVDDDAALRRELSEVLSSEGYSVVTASDGRQALNYLERNPAPSLILLDLMMPVMDGWEFSATVKSDKSLASIPIVVMSCLEKSEANASLLGASGVLRKPLRLEKLIAIAAAHTRESRAEK
jgi:signal transduction histidine kinase/ActR/RegA family two-component response regulator